MNRHDIWQRITCRHGWNSHSGPLVSVGTQGFLISSPKCRTWEACFLFICLFSQIVIYFLCCLDYVHCVNWNFHQSFVALESFSKLRRFEWVIFFLHSMLAWIACKGMPWCVLLDEWCVFPVLLSSHTEKSSRKFFFRYHMKLIHSTCILIYVLRCRVILYYHVIAF